MIKNYLKIAYRNLLKHQFYTLLNVLGLSIGLASFLLIAFYVIHELSYDQFHEYADRMYRIRHRFVAGDQEFDMEDVAPAFAREAKASIPQIAQSVRTTFPNPYIYKKGTEILPEQVTIQADPNFFQFFGYKLLTGTPAEVLKKPRSIVMTRKAADAVFGSAQNGDFDHHPAIGQSLLLGEDDYTITGIAENIPANSHLQFDVIMTHAGNQYAQEMNDFWLPAGFMSYVILEEGSDPAELKSSLLAMEKIHEWPQLQERLGVPLATLEARQAELGHYLRPVTDIHLISEGHMKYVYILSIVGLFLLIMACINYVNLVTARSAKRAREVGIRKVLGTTRDKLIGQFISESVLLTLLAMLLALGIAEAMRIPFNHLTDKAISFNLFQNPQWLFAILLLTLIIGVLAGIYPAVYLSVFRPAEVLKGSTIKHGSQRLRNGLVVFQFCVSATLIICALIVYQQLMYMQDKEIGFNKENVMLVPNAYTLHNREAFRQELLQYHTIEGVSFSTTAPGDHFDAFTTFHLLGAEAKQQAKFLGTDAEFLKVLDLQIIKGQNIKSDTIGQREALLNEQAAALLGTDDIIGNTIETFHGERWKVAGIVKDFNYEHLRSAIMPLIIVQDVQEWPYYTSIKIKGDEIAATVGYVEKLWQKYDQDALFSYSFLDRKFNGLFKAEQRFSVIIAVFTGLIIFIACIGLLGLVAYIAEQRTKEIGIRKVLGATIGDVVMLLSGRFTRLILLGFLLAVPIAYWLMWQWLSDFEFHVDVAVWPFVLAVAILLIIAWLAISVQSIKAAIVNPVKSLRSE